MLSTASFEAPALHSILTKSTRPELRARIRRTVQVLSAQTASGGKTACTADDCTAFGGWP